MKCTDAYASVMDQCAFCPRPAPGRWALTAQAVDGSWRREILSLCVRCDDLMRQGGEQGRVLKATGERWYGGWTMGRPEPKWTPNQDLSREEE